MPTVPRPAGSLLALALAVGVVSASAPMATLGGEGASSAPDRAEPAARGAVDGAVFAPARPTTVDASHRLSRGRPAADRVASVPSIPADVEPPRLVDWISRSRSAVPEPKAKSIAKDANGNTGSAASGAFKGRNHVWIPSLGIDRSISFYSCSSSVYPGNRVYRWGCAGSNNVYLFGHAHSVFKPLHDAYVRGRLSKGMKVHFANDAGAVATYAVSWWKVTTPDKGAWAFAAQSKPSLTLQTCVGARSQYRLIVRLTKVG